MEIKFSYADTTGQEGQILFPHKATVTDIKELSKYMCFDNTLIEFKYSYRHSRNFIKSDYAAFDLDNSHTEDENMWIQIEDIKKVFPDVWCLIITSRNHMKIKKEQSARPRFHIIFKLNTITKAQEYSDFMRRVYNRFSFFDSKALDAARYLFGSPEAQYYEFEGNLTIDEFMNQEEEKDVKFAQLDYGELPPIEQGFRNGTMSDIAGKIVVRFGIGAEAEEYFAKHAERCDPPLEPDELKSIWHSAKKFYHTKVVKKKGYIPPESFNEPVWDEPIPLEDIVPIPFPVMCLPECVRNYAKELAESTQTPIDMSSSAILAVLAICCQGKYKIKGKDDWIEPLNLYSLIVAEPSERKSAVISAITKPLNEYEEKYNLENASLFQRNKLDKRILDGRLKSIEARAINGKATKEELDNIAKEVAEFKELKPLKLYVDDITTEKLIQVLKDNDSKAAIVSSEGGLFDIISGMYSKNVNIDVFLKGYSSDALRVDRIGRDSEMINNPTLSILLTVQPSVVRSVMQNNTFKGRGLTARFLYSYPTSTIGTRNYRSKSVSEESYQDYKNTIYSLLSDNSNNQIISLSEGADDLLEDFAVWLEPKLKTDYSEIADWAGKLVGTILRISGILSRSQKPKLNDFLTSNEDFIVDRDTMKNAMEIGKYYLEHAKNSFFVLSDDFLVKECKHVLNQIKKLIIKEFSRRDIMRMCGQLRNKDYAQKVIDHLVDYGYIQPKPDMQMYKLGRPYGQKYLVNPKILEGK